MLMFLHFYLAYKSVFKSNTQLVFYAPLFHYFVFMMSMGLLDAGFLTGFLLDIIGTGPLPLVHVTGNNDIIESRRLRFNTRVRG